MKSIVNFHIHTVFSDGGKTVGEVVQGLKDSEVQYFAITDHDCVDGNIEAAELAKANGLKHINGVEISCNFTGEIPELDESCNCHIVGLNFELGLMRKELERFTENKKRILGELLDRLISDGYDKIDKTAVCEDGIPERTKIAKELVKNGYVTGTNQAFVKVLNNEKYWDYVKVLPSVDDAICAIKRCGGIAVWAHPFGYSRGGKRDLKYEQVERLAQKLFSGENKPSAIEVFYQQYDKEQIDFLNGLAQKYGTLKSIGTDYHHNASYVADHPQALEQFQREKLFFDVDGVTPDESITEAL